LKFNLPVKEYFWVTQLYRTNRDNDIFNFSNTTNATSVRDNIMQTCVINYNGIERFKKRKADYFRLIQPYYRHTRSPNDFFYIYSFSIKPEEYQPSGLTNLSKINNVNMTLELQSGLDIITYRCYVINYNVLRIYSGMGGLAFSD